MVTMPRMSDPASRLTISEDGEGSDDGAARTLVLAGEIDAHTAPDLAARLDELVDGAGDVTVDMAAVDFIDSSGLRVLIDAHNRTLEGERRLVLRAPSAAVSRLVEIAGLAGHFNVDS